ncbi:fibronectin type III domain-containing protein [Paenibacillus sp. GD4]|uniref:fibronectin type III domain-containing protein n=1 Tax=Paenibacillus sp. GD4 TaxID=3068890 RepID=UPI002796BE44|nr:fibronectin type III domain-containing protein [Paenibacillus sp. GD4]MDQ1911076.1 fibronectin type III domain-containing protein [Paenibacillus sp. GD4]
MTLSRVASRGKRPKKKPPVRAFVIILALMGVLAVLGLVIFNGLDGQGPKTQTAPEATLAAVKTEEAAELEPTSIRHEVTLWTPPRVDAEAIELTFQYAAPQESSIQVRLQVKPEGAAAYKEAALQNTPDKAAAGKHVYSATWKKAEDGVKAGDKVDLKLSVTAGEAPAAEYEVRNVRFQSREVLRQQVQNYLIYYGDWTDTLVDEVRQKYQMVVLHTQRQITAEQIQRLRGGKDPHDASQAVLVLGYLSVGEDLRTAGMTPEDMKKDSRFVLDGSGPAADPQPGAPYPDGSTIPEDTDILGTMAGSGYAPFYLSDGSSGKAAEPEISRISKAAFVNPGHPAWLEALKTMTKAKDRVSGLSELLGREEGAGYGCDGLFLDTLDTAAPNSFTDSSSANPREFEWTAKGTQELLRKIRSEYPGSLLLANRGLFFYHPDLEAYRYTLRGIVDFVLYDGFKLDSGGGQWYQEAIFHDNKYNYGQKLLAEADRPDGFKVLSLGYAEGPDGDAAKKALQGDRNTARDMLLDDLLEAASLGMVHYSSSAALTEVNSFALEHTPKEPQPPVWGNTKTPAFGKPFAAPREGAQKLERRGKDVYIQWDVAHSNARPVGYTLYVKEGETFRFNKDLAEQSQAVVDLRPEVPSDYAGRGERAGRFPYEAKVEGLTPGKTYFLVIRAKNAAGQYEENRKVMRVVAP